jgi:hypothetical protein
MATYVLQNSAQQIDQAVTAAYSGLVLGGTGLVRNTGTQTISGVKTFADQIVFSSGAILGNPTELNAVKTIIPTGNANVDLGSASNRFKTGWFSGISGSVGVFQNLTVLGTLNATIVPASTLDNSTGNNVTLSGTTNLNNANFSGNINSAGTTTFSGNLNVTGNSVFNGTITATGNKTFSGDFSQTGNSSFFGAFTQSGTLFSTGTWNHTGNFNQTGVSAFLGSVSINSPNAAFNFSGDNSNFNVISNLGVNGVVNITGSCNVSGAQHAIAGNIIHTGSFNHSGATILIGGTRNTGDFSVVGNSSFSGGVVFTGRATITSGVNVSGTSSAPALVLNRNLTTNASGGAIEYGSNGAFYLTTETLGIPQRFMLNPSYSIIAPSNSNTIAMPSTGTFYPILNNTGIYLTTGTYHFFYNVNFGNAGAGSWIRMGLQSAGNSVFSKRHGLAYNRFTTNGNFIGYGYNITGNGYGLGATNIFGTTRSDETYVYAIPYGDIYNLHIYPNGTNTLNNFIFDCVVTLTGTCKVLPVINPSNVTTMTVGIREFNMRVTQLTAGTGLGLASASGPWSDA